MLSFQSFFSISDRTDGRKALEQFGVEKWIAQNDTTTRCDCEASSNAGESTFQIMLNSMWISIKYKIELYEFCCTFLE